MKPTKDNWIKALPKEVKDILLQVADGALSMEGVGANEYTLDMIDRENEKGIYKQMIAFISQVEKDAKSESYTNGFRDGFDAGVEKTNKRWREKIMRFSMPSCPISSMEYPPAWWYSSFGMAIKEDFMRRISDLLEDKK